jgi:hypothetical protein
MAGPIDLNRQLRGVAVEVEHIGADRMLLAEAAAPPPRP